MMRRLAMVFTLSLASQALVACADPPSIPTSSFSLPIDFAFACEGKDSTTGLEYAGTGASEQWCSVIVRQPPGGNATETEAELYGLVLNQDPPGVLLTVIDPSSSDSVGGAVLDADPFTPGFSPIRVGANPIRLLKAHDSKSFYVISAGSRTVTKLVLKSVASVMRPCDQVTAEPNEWPACYELSVYDIPGTPSDAAIFEGALVVTSAWSNEAWVYDLTQAPPTPSAVALPGSIESLKRLANGNFVATWLERGVVSLLDQDLNVLDEQGVTHACADGLDNDGDGFADHLDPDCRNGQDRDEAATATSVPAPTVTEPPTSYGGGASFCEDGIDNDGNGLTDAEEGARCDDPAGEGLAECGDGIDNDGDGQTDTADTSCFSEDGIHEGQLGPFGHYQLAVVEAGDAGTFAYVADPQRARIAVYAVGEDTLARIDVNAHQALSPRLEYRAKGEALTGACEDDDQCSGDRVCSASVQACVSALPALRTEPFPERVHSGETDLVVSGATINSLTAMRVRGELWDRAIAQGSVAATSTYQPSYCDPTLAAASGCQQPSGDADSHYVFTPQADGKLRMVQSVVRGVTRHRYSQSVANPQLRGWSLNSKPSLTFFGRSQTSGSVLASGFSFMGPVVEKETITEAVEDEAPARLRSYGVYAPELDTYEQVTTQSWRLDYEGTIEGASGQLGRLVAEDTFFAPGQTFCERGVEVGDWLVLRAPTSATAPELHYVASLQTDAGDNCALEPSRLTNVEVRVTSVGMHTLEVDPTTARLIPSDLELDDKTIRDGDKNILNTCKNALEAYRTDRLMLPPAQPEDGGYFVDAPVGAFKPGSFPSRVHYEVRVADQWAVTGSVVGFAHRWAWDGTQCLEDETRDPRLQARLTTESFDPAEVYSTCPAAKADVELEPMEVITDRQQAFSNYSFEVHMLPGCALADDDATTIAVPDRRGTRWSFVVVGPDGAGTSTLGEAAFTRRLGVMEKARAIVYMDTAGNRMRLLRFWHRFNAGQSFSKLFD